MNYIQIDRDVLYDLYITQNLSIKQIANMYNAGKTTIQSKLVKYGIVKDKKEISKTIHKYDKYNTNKYTIYDLYIVQNKSIEEVAKILDISRSTLIRRLKEYNFIKDKAKIIEQIEKNNIEKYGTKSVAQVPEFKEKIKKTNLEKYGVEYPIKNKDVMLKMKQTNLERYGVECTLQSKEIQNKRKQTNLEKYGVEYPLQSEQIKRKVEKTNLERYGVGCTFQSEEVKEKIKKVNLERYGVENVSQSTAIRKKVKNTRLNNNFPNVIKYFADKETTEDFLKKNYNENTTLIQLSKDTGVSRPVVGQYIHKYGLEDYIEYDCKISQPEKDIVEYLTSKGITNILQSDRDILDGKEIDIYLPDYNVGIEFNGDYWHSEVIRPNKRYHYDKSMLANSKGVFLYHIFSHEWFDEEKRTRILNHLDNILHLNENKIYARKCMIREVDVTEKNDFLNENHIQGKDNSTIKLGLYYNDELVSLMTFCYPRFSKKYNWELSRFCSKHNYNVIGGASKLFKYFVDNYMKDGEVIVSYSDIAKTTGKIYNTLNFEFVNDAEPNYIWWKSDDDYKTRYQCQMVNERIIMESNGYIKIYDCGNKVWVFRK